VGHVVDDAHREVVARALPPDELVVDRLDLGRGEVLGGEAVAPADHDRVDRERALAGLARLADAGDDVEVEGLADGAGLLRPVEHGDRADGAGERGREVLQRERPVRGGPSRGRPSRRGRRGARPSRARPPRPSPSSRSRARPGGGRRSRTACRRGPCARRSGPSSSRRCRGRRGRSRCTPRGPGRRRRGSGRCRAGPACPGSSPAPGARRRGRRAA